MGMFIVLQVDQERCVDAEGCSQCVAACPVDVFRLERGGLVTDPENEDECTLCGLCLRACPHNAIRLIKVYELEEET
jgi:NAD-dependent dihydropyrimidine dehydrogenase PreA subunit